MDSFALSCWRNTTMLFPLKTMAFGTSTLKIVSELRAKVKISGYVRKERILGQINLNPPQGIARA